MQRLKEKLLLFGQRRIEKGAWVLAPLSSIWRLVSFLKNFAYDKGLLTQTKVQCPVVSIGNLVAGGTGKTPLTILLASQFKHRRVAILTRGYGKIPDEALLMQRRLDAKVYIGKNRVSLAKKAVEEGAELIFLDDGFQHRKLFRDLDVVTLSGEDPFGKGHFLPWGFLRDSPKRLKKADAIFVLGELKTEIPFPYTMLKTKVTRILDAFTGEEKDITGKKIAIFSAIAKPHLFRKTVPGDVVLEKVLFDHGTFSQEALENYCKDAQVLGAKALVCTEKDAVKLRLQETTLPIYYLEVVSEVVSGSIEKLIAKINEKLNN